MGQQDKYKTSNLRIANFQDMASPQDIKNELNASEISLKTVVESRKVVRNIITGKDQRLLAIVGPCSIHDPKIGLEYATRLKELQKKLEEHIYIVMRVYFEKPRTRLGWRGLIIDPHLDGTQDIQEGIRRARKLLLEITELGIPAGSEMLDPIIPQYIDDLLSWGAIGARTTESQTHREMASGLSIALGFKNGTDGSIETAVNAMSSSLHAHRFIGIDGDGKISIISTTGNDLGHVILRGGKSGPNYYREKVEEAGKMLRSAKLTDKVMIDCSHANSSKDYRRQHIVLDDVIRQYQAGVEEIMGFMLESNLYEGNQQIPEDISQLKYGVSITDSCISWDETEKLLLQCKAILSKGRGSTLSLAP
jgi:3-deoxy-7-phosphoheptulonate synthase